MSEMRGYGIQFGRDQEEHTTVDKIQELLNLAPRFKEKVNTYISESFDADEVTVEAYAQFDDDYLCSIPHLLAEVISEKENIRVSASMDDNGFIYLYFPSCMPWELSEQEKTVTQASLTKIFSEYYHILYEDDPDIDFVFIQIDG